MLRLISVVQLCTAAPAGQGVILVQEGRGYGPVLASRGTPGDFGGPKWQDYLREIHEVNATLQF